MPNKNVLIQAARYALIALFLGIFCVLCVITPGCAIVRNNCLAPCLDAAIDHHVTEVRRLEKLEGLSAEERAALIPAETVLLDIERLACNVQCRQ